MLPALFSGTSIPVLEQVAAFTEARHNVLAGNLANMDTPGYRVRDLSPTGFQAQLRSAIAAGQNAGTSPGSWGMEGLGVSHPSSPGTLAPQQQAKIHLADLLHHDDSNVSLEQQVAEITKNQLSHNLALNIMTAQFRLIEAAISERT